MNLFDDEITEDAGGFSPSRLTLARMRRGLKQEELADGVGLDKTTISRYENGERQPDEKTALALSEYLSFPVSFFYQNGIGINSLEAVSFRSRRSEVKLPTRLRTLSAGHLAADVVDVAIKKRFTLPLPDLPQITNVPPHIAAERVRAEWGLGQRPISNLIHLMETKGIRIFWFDEDDKAVDAVSFYRHSLPFALLSQRNRSGERVRADLAHELGHLVMHRGVNESDLSIKQIEDEANAFAAAFLVPGEQFRRECSAHPLMAHLFSLKPRWGVSLQMLIHRCYDLGIYTESQYQNSFRKITANGWRVQEPGQLEWEESKVFDKVFSHLAKHGISPEDIAKDMHILITELEGLIPVISRYRNMKIEPFSEGHFKSLEELGYTAPKE